MKNKSFILLVVLLLLAGRAAYAGNTGWNDFLQQYVHDGRVDYAAVQGHPEELESIFKSFASVSAEEFERISREEKIAYWINLYNFLVIRTIVQNYPIRSGFSWKKVVYPSNSIQQIANVWKRPVLKVRGRELSLDAIEHEILRAKFHEPRIHFALVCASIGCPVLRSEAYEGMRLDEQLEDQVKQFLSDPEKFRYDENRRVVYLSPIFKWFEEDFEKAGGAVAFINRYLQTPVSSKANTFWLDYDWSLNDYSGGAGSV